MCMVQKNSYLKYFFNVGHIIYWKDGEANMSVELLKNLWTAFSFWR